MATSITAASFRTVLGECADAIDSGNWATAYKKYAKAEAIHSGLEASSSSGATNIRRREALDGLRRALDAAQAAAEAGVDDERRLITTQTRHP